MIKKLRIQNFRLGQSATRPLLGEDSEAAFSRR